MEIRRVGNLIEIDGIIKTINDSQDIINEIRAASNTGSVIVRINDSFSFPSTIIAELLKLKDNGVNIVLEIKDSILYELFEDLNLVKAFNVTKIY